MNIAVLHPQCRVGGGALSTALLTAQTLKKQGHKVVFYTFEHDSECFPELQEGLTIVTGKTTKKNTAQQIQKTKDKIQNEGSASGNSKLKLDTVDKQITFWGFLSKAFPHFSSIIGIAWDVRQVDIVIANTPPMQIVGALAKFFSFFSEYHQRLVVIWWHHSIPRYYTPQYKVHSTKYKIASLFSSIFWKGLFEKYEILPRVKYLVANSYYAAFCIEKYCGRKAIVIHPVIMKNEEGRMKNEGSVVSGNQGNERSVVLFTHGPLEPGKGLDTLVKAWKELQQMNNEQGIMNNEGLKLIIAGEGSLKNWLTEQGATVISYTEGLLRDLRKTENDILAIYLSTVDAFNEASLEAQIAGFPVIILDKGGARETVLLDNNNQPIAQLIDAETEIVPAITYFIQQRTLQKRVSNVNFCHQREYFTVSRFDADIRSLIDSVR